MDFIRNVCSNMSKKITVICFILLVQLIPTAYASHTAVTFGGNEHLAKTWTYLPHMDVGGHFLNHSPHREIQVDLFLPLLQSYDHLLFSDIRAFDMKPDSNDLSGSLTGVNVYLASRRMLSERTLFGFYGSIDRVKTEEENYFNQITIGEEYWRDRWFMGANLYLPFGAKKQKDRRADIVRLVNSEQPNIKNIQYAIGYERSLPGASAEVGYELLSNGLSRLTLYGGGYYFKHRDVPSLFGPRGRMTYEWIAPDNQKRFLGAVDRISLEGEIQKDRIRGLIWKVGLRLTVGPLTKDNSILKGVRKHMVDPLRSEEMVSAEKTHSHLGLLKDNQGTPIKVAEVTSWNQFRAALDNPEIYLIDVEGTINDFNEMTIDPGRPLYITGGEYEFDSDGHHFIAKLGTQGQLNAANGQNLLNIAEPNYPVTIRDLWLRNVSNNRFAITNTDTLGIDSLLIQNVDSTGPMKFSIDGSGNEGNIELIGNKIDTSANAALSFKTSNNGVLTVHASDNTISGNRYGIDNNASSSGTITLSDFLHNTISSDNDGISNTSSAGGTIALNNFSYNAISALDDCIKNNIPSSGGTITFNSFSNNTMSGKYGIYNPIYSEGTIIFNNFSHNTISGSQGWGIYNSTSLGTKITFSNFSKNIISGKSYGIHNSTNSGTIIISNFLDNTISANTYGIYNRPGNPEEIKYCQTKSDLNARNTISSITDSGNSVDYGSSTSGLCSATP